MQDHLHVVIHPDYLKLSRRQKGVRRKLVDEHYIAIKNNEYSTPLMSVDNTLRDHVWAKAIMALKIALQNSRWKSARPSVELSNHFIRYAVIPWKPELIDRSEKKAFIQHSFNFAYGEIVKGWDLKMSKAPYGKAALASGTDTELLKAIHLEFEQAGMSLKEIHPKFMAVVNTVFKKNNKGKTPFWLVIAEQGRLSIALLNNYEWILVRGMASDIDPSKQIQTAIHRESIIAGLEGSDFDVYLFEDDAMEKKIYLPQHRVSRISINTDHDSLGLRLI